MKRRPLHNKPRPLPPFVSTYLPLSVLLLAGFWLRLRRLDFQPLWGDEGWSFYFAAMPIPRMINATAIDIHPPLYYALLHSWLALCGYGPYAARLLSVGTGLLLIPLCYTAARRVAGSVQVGLWAAFVATISPIGIYYSQEVRMYVLVTALGLASSCAFLAALKSGRRRDHAAYVALTASALYTHYYALFIPLFHAAYVLVTDGAVPIHRPRELAGYFRRRRGPLAAVALACASMLPWAIFCTGRLLTYVRGKRVAEGYTPMQLHTFLAKHAVAFSIGHASYLVHQVRWGALLFVGLAVLGVWGILHLRRGRKGPAFLALYLLVPVICGWLINLAYPFSPPYFERTLLLAAPPFWLLVGAGLARLHGTRRALRYPLAGGAASAVIFICTISLLDFYNVPRYPYDDYRAVMQTIRARSTQDDVLVISYQWQMGYCHAYLQEPHPELYTVPGWGSGWADDEDLMRREISALLEGHRYVWFPAHQALGHLWEDRAEDALASIGYPAMAQWFGPNTRLVLTASAPESLPPAPGAPFDFGGMLTAKEVLFERAEQQSGLGAVRVQVTWQKEAPLGETHRVNLRLVDDVGNTWASRDAAPQGGRASFTDIDTGETLPDRHALPIPAGTPPGTYHLRMSIRVDRTGEALDVVDGAGQPTGVEAELGDVQVVRPAAPLDADALPIQTPLLADFGDEVRLLGYSIGSDSVGVGEEVRFSLFWQALREVEDERIVFVQAQDEEGQPLALSETPPPYPVPLWRTGDLLRDPHALLIPPDMPEGRYRLVVGLLRPDRSRVEVSGGTGGQVDLTTFEVYQRARSFEAPSPTYPADADFGGRALLVGYDLEPDAPGPGGSLKLRLYWKAAARFERRYKVFVHLVDGQGHIVSQKDKEPAGDFGQIITTSWLEGEYLEDVYELLIPSNASPGSYSLELGLYNPLDFTRLEVHDASGRAVGDSFTLQKGVEIRD